ETSRWTECGTMLTRFSVVEISQGMPMENSPDPVAFATFSGMVSRLKPNLCVHCVMCRNPESTKIADVQVNIHFHPARREMGDGHGRPLDEAKRPAVEILLQAELDQVVRFGDPIQIHVIYRIPVRQLIRLDQSKRWTADGIPDTQRTSEVLHQ